MAFIPNNDADRKEMLAKIGIKSFDELINNLPKEIVMSEPLDIAPRLSEYEVFKHLEDMAKKNQTADTHVCFMGGGAYDHFIPAIVGSVLQKPEFRTAYTPYQAEVSQGTLQAMYEFQTMVCQLMNMDVANASLYDGATSLAEACLMAHDHNKKKEFLIAGTINPKYLKVCKTVTAGQKLVFKEFITEDGTADLDGLKAAINENTSGVIVQHPNFYGTLEEVHEIKEIVRSTKALYIAVVQPMSLGIIDPPGEYDADVAVAEGQSLGIPLSYGGPYLGLFACKSQFVRKMPGRLAGVTQDENGERAFVLTLQTREQQIKREKATSNICTNQGLYMLAATVYLEATGKQGLKETAEHCYKRAHYLADKINALEGYSVPYIDKAFFNEFFVETPVPAGEIIRDAALNAGFLAGLDTARFKVKNNGLLVAVTEKRTKKEMDDFVDYLKKYSK